MEKLDKNQKTASQECIELLKMFEGVRLERYLDSAGLPTIGVGHLIRDGESFQKITLAQAEQLLKKDIAAAAKSVNRSAHLFLNQQQFDALVSFVFNIGVGNFEKSTMLRLLNKGQYKAAAGEFDRWAYVKLELSKGLARRRAVEKALFLGATLSMCRDLWGKT